MKKITISLIVLITSLSGCKKFLNVNKDPNNPTNVQEALLLAPIEVSISDNVYAGNAPVIIQDFIQGIAPNQPNPGFWNYQVFNTDFDGDWNAFYVITMNNLKILNDKAEADAKLNYAAIAKILTAYTLGTATDFWGDIPYSQAFQGISRITPVYDKQEDIYKDVQSLLSSAIAEIGQASTVTPGTDDYFYNGTMSSWLKLAYVLKARYFMHLTKAPGYTAAVQADSALNALTKGMQANSDDLGFAYAGAAGTENSWYLTFSPVSTYVMNSTVIDSLKARNDPRLPKMAKTAVNTGLYTGRTIGSIPGDLNAYSYPSDYYAGISASNYIVTYNEALFLQAEATLIKSGYSAAQPVYQQAITQHMLKLGVAQTDIDAYVVTRGTLTAANALQRIMEEKSVANFLNEENWTDWRRTGFPLLTKVSGALSEIPRRLLYSESDILTNPQPQQSAKLTDRVWWDAQ
ncbi:MAG TPA: SusD/RagB family nutrient-binding outer membrane lipoprotein [Puia sp.]|nr:SusD/RagB family nutrient-binding outer membrane lipoprotein [Puia sp.]